MENPTRPPVVVGVDGSLLALRAVRWADIRNALRAQGWRWLAKARSVVGEVSTDLRPGIVLSSVPVVPPLVRESRDATLLVLGGRAQGPVVVGVDGLPTSEAAVAFAEASLPGGPHTDSGGRVGAP